MRDPRLFLAGAAIVFTAFSTICLAADKPAAKATRPAAATMSWITGKAAIRQVLEKKITVEAKETPLSDLIESVSRRLAVQIQSDKKALEDVGITDASPVTCNLRDISGRAALEFIAGQFDLAIMVFDEVVLFTTPERADAALDLIIYDVTDLVLFQDEKGDWCEKSEDLVNGITSCVQPNSWGAVGGPGALKALSLPTCTVLSVSQTERVHEELERFLADLRKAEAAKRKGQRLPEPTVEQMLRRTRAVSKEPVQELDLSSQNKLASDPARDVLVDGANGFAWTLYGRLAKESNDNVFCSPISVATVLGMLQAGARAETNAELARALGLLGTAANEPRWALAEDRIQPAFASLLGTLAAQRATNGYDLTVANRLWGQMAAYQPEYIDLLAKHYKADAVRVDFGRPVEVAKQINDWIAQATSGFLRGDIDPRLFNAQTNMVLANAVYFHGLWAEPFEPTATQNKSFFGDQRSLEVPMMSQVKHMGYAEVDGVQVLEKGYLGNAVSMMVILPPKEPKSLAALESRLSPELYKQWLQTLQHVKVEVQLPRFTFETKYDLKKPLAALGVKTAFQPGAADFSGISGNRDLFVQSLLHQARIEVDEKGTRAAAVTAAFGGGMGGPPPKRNIFIADHPYLFVIRDNRTGAILFIGRVAMPSQDRFRG